MVEMNLCAVLQVSVRNLDPGELSLGASDSEIEILNLKAENFLVFLSISEWKIFGNQVLWFGIGDCVSKIENVVT
jgi:hypothetical protein